MSKVLVVYYSQSGQLRRVTESLIEPLQASGARVDVAALEPQQPYPFPWPFWQFLDAFPECVYLDPRPIKAWQAAGPYDLILLCYTVWFLSPAPPVTAFLQSAASRELLHDTPVVTVTACRNMWIQAQEDIKALLAPTGARHCDHVALVDPGPALATFITTPRWMFTGRRDAFWGMPAAGLRDQDIAASRRFGRALATALAAGRLDGSRPVLAGLAAARIDPALMLSERIGKRSFRIWGRLVRAAGRPGAAARRPVLALYITTLILMIVTIVPLTMLLRAALWPVLKKRMLAQAAIYEAPSGCGTDRMGEFA